MNADEWTTAVSVVGLAVCTAGSWVVSIELWMRNRALREQAAAESARTERYRAHLCRVACRAVCVDALWQERDAAIAECDARSERERMLELEVENLRAQAGRGAA
jgi:hypothetical protein